MKYFFFLILSICCSVHFYLHGYVVPYFGEVSFYALVYSLIYTISPRYFSLIVSHISWCFICFACSFPVLQIFKKYSLFSLDPLFYLCVLIVSLLLGSFFLYVRLSPEFFNWDIEFFNSVFISVYVLFNSSICWILFSNPELSLFSSVFVFS